MSKLWCNIFALIYYGTTQECEWSDGNNCRVLGFEFSASHESWISAFTTPPVARLWNFAFEIMLNFWTYTIWIFRLQSHAKWAVWYIFILRGVFSLLSREWHESWAKFSYDLRYQIPAFWFVVRLLLLCLRSDFYGGW